MTNKYPLDPGLFRNVPWTNDDAFVEEEEEEEEDREEQASEEDSEEVEEDQEEEERQENTGITGFDPPMPQDYELPGATYADLEEEYGDDQTPAGFKQLFSPRTSDDLVKVTDTPAKMVLPLVRSKVIVAATNPARQDSLLEVFMEEFDKRMISKDRKGRIEAVELIRGLNRREDDEEEAGL
jgi:hypothetical protein